MNQIWLLSTGVDYEGEGVVCAFAEKPTAEKIEEALKPRWSGSYYEKLIDLPALSVAVLQDERAYAYGDIYVTLDTTELKAYA